MSSEFETLVRTHQAAVCATAYSVLRDRARAEEVAQDAFLLAWQKLPSLTEPPRMPAWICGIARNLARNLARKRREVAVIDDNAADANIEGPLESLMTAEARAVAERALESLSESDREAITLYYMGESEHADVARALGISETSARQRVHRARTKLRDAAAAVENMVRTARPGPAFTVACVAALAAGRVVDASAATFADRTVVSKTVWIAAGAAAVIVAGGVVTTRGETSRTNRPGGERTTPVTASIGGSASGAAADRAGSLPRISPAMRDDLLARLRRAPAATDRATQPAFAEPTTMTYDFSGGPLEGATPVPPPKPGESAKRVVRYAIQEIQPLLAECHAGLASNGLLPMHVVLLGGPDIGTVVESVDIDPSDPSGGAFEPAFVECMQETLYALELPALPTLERWDVHYPFTVTASR